MNRVELNGRERISALRLVARIPINLDDEHGLASEEVDDVIADDDLAPELRDEQTTTPHQAPRR